MKLRSVMAALWLVAVAAGLSAFSVGGAVAQTVSSTRYDGVLTVIWGDPRRGASGGATRFTLHLPDGTARPLQIAPDQQNEAINYFGQRVVVFGRAAQRAAGTGPSAIQVDRLEALSPARLEQQRRAVTTRRVLFILLKYSGDAQEPQVPTYFDAQLTNPLTPPAGSLTPATINGFYNRTSWGKLRWQADVAGVGGLNPTQWFTLSKPKTGYANCGWSGFCADLDGIANEAMTLAQNAGVNLSVYDNVNFVLNNDLDCCAWGGGTFFNGKVYGATWEPPWGHDVSTYVHEMSHSLGLPHSGWVYYAYDSPWDILSGIQNVDTQACGSYNSANSGGTRTVFCGKPGGAFITAHKDRLGWIPAANKVVINTTGQQTVTLAANAGALGTSIKMIKICIRNYACTGSTARFLTVEARINSVDYDKGLPGNGVIIHDVRMNRAPIGGGNPCIEPFVGGGWAVPIDRTRGDWDSVNCNSGGRVYPNYALFNAQYTPGKAYNNSKLGINVRVLSRNGPTYSVQVTKSQ